MGEESGNTVGDLVSLQRGITYKGSLVGVDGPALLGLGSIEPGGGFKHAGFKTYGGDCPDHLLLFPGELYVALKGATKDGKMIGSVARLPRSVPVGRITQDTVKLVLRDQSPGLPNYLYWLLRTPQYREYCASRAMGSAVVALSRQDFLDFPVPPQTPQRDQLVRLLEALDDKIELNRRMSETLEEQARALFKSWFVDFDPVRAKAEGRDPGLPKHLADLFPDSFEDSELGEIPKGWEVQALDQIADYANGAACQKYTARPGETSFPVIKIRDLNQGFSEQSARVRDDFPDKHRAEDGDVLFSWSGTLSCRIWTAGSAFVNQHIFKVSSLKFPQWCYFYWTIHHLEDFKAIAAGKATTMGHIKRQHLSEAAVLIPPAAGLAAMTEVFSPLMNRHLQAALESRTFTTLRDTLLPKLISGELRVKDAERWMEELAP